MVIYMCLYEEQTRKRINATFEVINNYLTVYMGHRTSRTDLGAPLSMVTAL